MWAACTRYVTAPQVRSRVGSGTDQFLLVKFPKVQFAEVTIGKEPRWETAEHTEVVSSFTRDLDIDFSRACDLGAVEFPDLSEISSNSTLDFMSEELSKSQDMKARLTPLQLSKTSTVPSPDISPISQSKEDGVELIRSQSTRSVTSSGVSSSLESGQMYEEMPRYEIFDSTLEF